MKLRKRVKQDWIAALTGGEYNQGQSRLRVDDSFCCLGVLCDLAVLAGEGRWDGEDYVAPDGSREHLTLSAHVAEWAFKQGADVVARETSWDDPLVTRKNGDEVGLTDLNDAQDKSFSYIAKAIERSL